MCLSSKELSGNMQGTFKEHSLLMVLTALGAACPQNVDPARREEIMDVLEINPNWKMNHVSDSRNIRHDLGKTRPDSGNIKVPEINPN
jgi:hypothetical protein